MIKAVIFDMDGLMLDTERVGLDMTVLAAKELGYDFGADDVINMIGRKHADCLKFMFDKLQDYEKVNILSSKYQEYCRNYYKENGIPVKKGLYELLDFLEKNNIKKVVASGSNRSVIKDLLKQISVWDRMDFVIGGDDVINGKPNPEIFIKACDGVGVPIDQAIVLEDSKPGIEAAYSAGIKSILIKDLAIHTPESEAKAYKICNDLSQVISYIN